MLWLCVDPGENTGFSLWEGKDLKYANQLPRIEFQDAVYKWLAEDGGAVDLGAPEDVYGKLGAMVVEDWKLYPWKLKDLSWDKCLTARLIGALEAMARYFYVRIELQGADIKEGAKAMGAEDLYLEPVHENRHANDSIQHGVYYLGMHDMKPPC